MTDVPKLVLARKQSVAKLGMFFSSVPGFTVADQVIELTVFALK